MLKHEPIQAQAEQSHSPTHMYEYLSQLGQDEPAPIENSGASPHNMVRGLMVGATPMIEPLEMTTSSSSVGVV